MSLSLCKSLLLSDEDLVGHRSFDSECSYLPLCLLWQMFHVCIVSQSFSILAPSYQCRIHLIGGIEPIAHQLFLFSTAIMSLSCCIAHWELPQQSSGFLYKINTQENRIVHFEFCNAVCAMVSHLVQLSKIKEISSS